MWKNLDIYYGSPVYERAERSWIYETAVRVCIFILFILQTIVCFFVLCTLVFAENCMVAPVGVAHLIDAPKNLPVCGPMKASAPTVRYNRLSA